ncbi:hypothetical protein LUZ60_012586 [Juncus effusus]|nr:hypothetical protein LUZ60_012586 [Juncus effusus]
MASSSSLSFTLSQTSLQSLSFPLFFFRPSLQKHSIQTGFYRSGGYARNLFEEIIVRNVKHDCFVRRERIRTWAFKPKQELENTSYLEKLEEKEAEVKHQKKRKISANGDSKRNQEPRSYRRSKRVEAWRKVTEKMVELLTKRRNKNNNKQKDKKNKEDYEFTVALDMCSKKGDFQTAISLYDSALEKGIELQEYHYNVLLYLCSSASTGSIHPSKSGTTTNPNLPKQSISINKELRDYARNRGFEIFKKMCVDGVKITETTLTSVSRMAMSMRNGDLAFNIVKNMKRFNLTPKLRSYEPALKAFCDNQDLEKAFGVEAHMSKTNTIPLEPELFLLLKLSLLKNRADKIYYLLHKLRTNVRQVSLETADLIQAWFESEEASRSGGERKRDEREIVKRMERNGGGWHGLGWLGKGKFRVSRTEIDARGFCLCCGERLETIDLDRNETEKFAVSVSAIASMREKHDSFKNFQEWLKRNGPFEAIIDGANVGLFSQKSFSLNQVNALIRALQRKLETKKWPLIILHNRRAIGENGRSIVEFWKQANAIYVTPTGSNDDWYWLYAAITCKSLIVTNDEMRDHTFQLLGNDFFLKWKEQHQVRFNYQDGKFEFQMPPPYSVVIQESKRGDWHIPIAEENGLEIKSERERTWLCVKRTNLSEQSRKNSYFIS